MDRRRQRMDLGEHVTLVRHDRRLLEREEEEDERPHHPQIIVHTPSLAAACVGVCGNSLEEFYDCPIRLCSPGKINDVDWHRPS